MKRESPRHSPRAEAGIVIEAAFVRPAVIIDNRLAQMKTVAQRRAADTAKFGVGAFHLDLRWRLACAAIDVGPEFAHQRYIDRPRLIVLCIGLDSVGAELEHVSNADASPWPHAEVSGVGVTERVQAIESRVDPVVDRYVNRALCIDFGHGCIEPDIGWERMRIDARHL